MIEYTIKFIVNPYDPDSSVPKWWPNYIMEKVLIGETIETDGHKYYKMKFLLGKQYVQQFENYIATQLKEYIISSEKSEL